MTKVSQRRACWLFKFLDLRTIFHILYTAIYNNVFDISLVRKSNRKRKVKRVGENKIWKANTSKKSFHNNHFSNNLNQLELKPLKKRKKKKENRISRQKRVGEKHNDPRHLCKHHTPSLLSQVALFPDRPDVQRGRSDHGSCGIRGPVSPLRTCRITARKLLNKRNTLTYDSPVLLHGASYVYLEGEGRTLVRGTRLYTQEPGRNRSWYIYWFKPCALSAHEYAGAR